MIEFAPTFFPQLTYDEAWVYCLTLDYNGHNDWRMPTHKEWASRNELLGWYENAKTVKKFRIVCPVREQI
jgi:hypothetical protein